MAAGRHSQALTAARDAEGFFKQFRLRAPWKRLSKGAAEDSGGLFRSVLLQGRLERALRKGQEAEQTVQRALALAQQSGNQSWLKSPGGVGIERYHVGSAGNKLKQAKSS